MPHAMPLQTPKWLYGKRIAAPTAYPGRSKTAAHTLERNPSCVRD